MNGKKKLLYRMAKIQGRGEVGTLYAINDENGTLLAEKK